ncbi:MAG: hypothetical protein ACI4LB_09660 [Candidatus Fimenecus sp.]
MKDFKSIRFEIIDINVNASPDIFINRNGISFSKKVLEDLNYPANVQFYISPEQKAFAVRACKIKESKSTPFSKPKSEQTGTLSLSNKNLIDIVRALLPKELDEGLRYKVTGFFDAQSRTMYFDMDEAKEEKFR